MPEQGLRCPTCRRAVSTGGADFPFCSERCRLVDLGHWYREDYRVSRSMGPLDGEEWILDLEADSEDGLAP